jgi:hypothetical protein
VIDAQGERHLGVSWTARWARMCACMRSADAEEGSWGICLELYWVRMFCVCSVNGVLLISWADG